MPYKLPPLGDAEIAVLARWVKEGAAFDGASRNETLLVSMVDVFKNLPKVALKVPAGDPVTALDFSGDGRLLAAGIGRELVLIDPDSTKNAATLGDHPGAITSVRFAPDGESVAAAGGRAWPVRITDGLGRGQEGEAFRGKGAHPIPFWPSTLRPAAGRWRRRVTTSRS